MIFHFKKPCESPGTKMWLIGGLFGLVFGNFFSVFFPPSFYSLGTNFTKVLIPLLSSFCVLKIWCGEEKISVMQNSLHIFNAISGTPTSTTVHGMTNSSSIAWLSLFISHHASHMAISGCFAEPMVFYKWMTIYYYYRCLANLYGCWNMAGYGSCWSHNAMCVCVLHLAIPAFKKKKKKSKGEK